MDLLRIPAFRLLLAGFFLSSMAGWAQRTAMLIWAFSLTNSGAKVSLVGLMEALPFLLLAPIAGVFVDRWSRSRTLALSAVVQAAALLPLLLVHSAAGFWLLMVVTLLVNSAGQFSMPAATAAIPVVVGQDRVGAANGLTQTLNSVVTIFSPGLAALLFALVGPHGLFVLLCVLYLASTPLLALVPAGKPEKKAGQAGSVMREMKDGLAYMRRSRTLMAILAMAFVALLGAGALSILDVLFISRALHMPTENVGLLYTANGVGQLLGGLSMVVLTRKVAARYHQVLAATSFLLGAAIIAYSLAPNLPVALAAIALCGLLIAPLMVSFISLVQLSAEDAYMGRVMSLLNSGITVASVISLASGGVLADAMGVRQVIGIAGVLVGISGLLSITTIRATPRSAAHTAAPERGDSGSHVRTDSGRLVAGQAG